MIEQREALRSRLIEVEASLPAGSAVALVGVDTRIMDCNDAYAELFDATPATLVGSSVLGPLVVDAADHAAHDFEDAVRRGRGFFGELLMERRPGVTFWNDVILLPGTLRVPGLEDATLIARDVTLRRTAAAELGMRSIHDRLVLDRVQAGIVLHKASTEILWANAKALELLGVENTAALGAVNTDPRWGFKGADEQLLPIDEYPVGVAVRTRAVARDILLGHDRPSDGKRVWLMCNAYPVADATGEVVEVVVSFTDVTRLKETERALAESDERMQLVMSGSTDSVWDIDLERNLYHFSARWWEMLGYSADDRPIEPADWEQLLHPADHDWVMARLEQLLASQERRYSIDCRMLHKSGSVVHVRSRGLIVRDAEGRPIRMSGTNTDLTERRALETRLHQAEKLQGIGQLAGGVAHDFNNLLAVVLGNLEVLQSTLPDGSEDAELVQEALTAVHRGADLTRRLLTFSRQQSLETTVLPIAPTIRGVASLLTRLLSESIEVRISELNVDLLIRVDPTLFESALLNLAINARDAMPRGGTLSIDVRPCRLPEDWPHEPLDVEPGAFVAVSVRDTGIGMSDEIRLRALEPFFTTKPTGRGTGLGLSMVYGFVTQSGGAISIQSAPGSGTTIHLFLPVAEAAARHEPSLPDGPATERASQGETVLVVEDDETVRRAVVRGLNQLGYAVIEAANGPAGVRAFMSAPRVDLVLTDVVMPEGMTGPDVAAEIHRLAPRIPVVFMTGYSADILDELLGSDDHFFLAKPFRIEDLRRVIREALSPR